MAGKRALSRLGDAVGRGSKGKRMRKSALIFLVAALSSCSVGQYNGGLSTAELRATNAGYDRALVDGDAAALARYYADDFTRIGNDANIHDKQDQIRTMSQVVDLIQGRSDDVRITPLGRDAALLTGRFTGRYLMDGKEDAFTERYTSIWLREDGEWKVRHEHASLVPKPEAASTA